MRRGSEQGSVGGTMNDNDDSGAKRAETIVQVKSYFNTAPACLGGEADHDRECQLGPKLCPHWKLLTAFAKTGRILTRQLSVEAFTAIHRRLATMPRLVRRSLRCFYCNKSSRNDQAGIPRTWTCPHCEALNHLDEVRSQSVV